MSSQSKIYTVLILSFSILLFSLVLSYDNIKKNAQTLKYLERDQTQLNFYVNKLNYDIKQNQAYILQAFIEGKDFTDVISHSYFKDIHKSITKLDTFIKTHPDVTEEFKEKLKVIKHRVIAYQIVQNSLITAKKEQDREDFEDALIGFNAITLKFSNDTSTLIELANKQLYEKIMQLDKNNTESSNTLIISFLIALMLITFSALKFNSLQKKIEKQLNRAIHAEKDLQHAQAQLLRYNDDLEDEIAKKSQELHEKIYTEFLSGLPNRNRLLEDMKRHSFTKIAILNVDKFQSFNDVYGEEIGNIAIKMTAEFLTNEIEDTQLMLYHIGGDEFVLGCTSERQSAKEFIKIINKVLTHYKEEKFIYEDKTFQFMMSAGISYGKEKKILAYADMALKDAKRRNIQSSVFNDDKELEQLHKDDIECHKKLIDAMERDAIVSFFQPIVPIQENSKLKIKYESLVRIDDHGTIIPPFRFIDVAKANRVYYRITRSVLQNTLDVVSKYQVECSINISLSDIDNEKTMKHFFYTIQNFEYNNLLTIELLETEDFNNYDAVYNFCIKVRSFGLKVALDDFGSGYSNFSHILNLPVDYIKIDATLISNIDRDYHSKLMVETIVELAKKLKILTIAEFVASKEILEVVREVGVDYAQGFYLGKPEPIEKHL